MNTDPNRADAAQPGTDTSRDPAAPAQEPQTEVAFLERQAQLAREALQRVRGEVLQSLAHSADIRAWGQRYPWPTMGAAAAAGLGTGWALGSIFRGKSHAAEAPVDAAATAGEPQQVAAEPAAAGQPASSKLLSGLGTMVGALTSAAVGAAAEAVAKVVKDSIQDSLHPEANTVDEDTVDENAADDDAT